MRILEIRPEPPGGKTVARYDVQLTPDCRLFNLRLVQVGPGRRLSFAPNARSFKTATFSNELADELTRAASDALEAESAHDHKSR